MNPRLAAPSPVEAGRPAELELWTNRRLIHPLSRALAARLARTSVSPNAVSMAGAVLAAVGAGAYTLMAWPQGPMLGLASHFAWHVLDGADGDLARRTGRSSPTGEIIDGLCDYAGRTVLYLALGAYGAAQYGAWVWPLAVLVGASRIMQANFYETVRREYRGWVYGTPWIRQTLAQGPSGAGVGGPAGALARLFLAVSRRVTPDSAHADAAIAQCARTGAAGMERTRAACREELRPVVRRAAILSTNGETVAIFLSMLAGSPIYLFVYVVIVLNGAYFALRVGQGAHLTALTRRLAPP